MPSKSRVNRAPRAHGPSRCAPGRAAPAACRRISACRNNRAAPRSRCRQWRVDRSQTARVDRPHGQRSRRARRRSSTTIPIGVNLTPATLAPGMASTLLNAVVARTRRAPRASVGLAAPNPTKDGACASCAADRPGPTSSAQANQAGAACHPAHPSPRIPKFRLPQESRRGPPRANAIAARWVDTVRRELLDRMLFGGRRPVGTVLAALRRARRPAAAAPLPRPDATARVIAEPAPPSDVRVVRLDRLGGLIQEHARVT
jgi:hypothetical protein